MRIVRRRKFNIKNLYIILITTFAIVSFGTNICQNVFYNQALQIQNNTISELSGNSNTQVMNNK